MKKINGIVIAALLALSACQSTSQSALVGSPTPISIGNLPVPSSGSTSLTSGDLVPADRSGVTYGLLFPSGTGGGATPGGDPNSIQFNQAGTALGGVTLDPGQIIVGQSGIPAPVTVGGDCSMGDNGHLACTSTNGTSFATSATTDTTNAANISTGILPSGRLPSLNTGTVLAGVNANTAVTLGQKFGYLIDVSAYGAIGDSTTDNCTPVQNAINNNPNRTIYFPKGNNAGNYKISCTILLTDPSGHNFQGNIVSDGATITFTNAGASTDTDANMQHGFQAYPVTNGTGGDVTGWDAGNLNGGHFNGLTVVGPTHGAGLYIANSIDIVVEGNSFQSDRYGVATETNINDKIKDNIFNANTNAGIGLLMSGNTNVWYGPTPSSTYWNDSPEISGNGFTGTVTGGLTFILDAGSQSERVRFIHGNSFFSGAKSEVQYAYISRNAQPTFISNWVENTNYPVRMIASNSNEGGSTTTLPGVTAYEPSGTYQIGNLPDGFSYGAIYEGNFFQAGTVDLDVSGVTSGTVLIGQNITNSCSGGSHIKSAQGGKLIIDMGDAVSSGSCSYLNNSFGGYLALTGMTSDTTGDYTLAGGITLGGSLTFPSARKGTFVCTVGGTITVANTNVLTASNIPFTLQTAGGTITTPPAMKTKTSGTGFSVLCGASDTSTYGYTVEN